MNSNTSRDPRDPVEAMRRMREKMKEDLARQREAERLFRLEQEGQELYFPSVFRYHCYGKLQLSSDLQGSEGVCRGLSSQIEHVRDLRRSTRQQAIDAFAPKLPSEMSDSFQHKDKELTRLLERDAMIYDEVKKDATGGKLNETEATTANSYHDWDLYGSTDVEIIILKSVVEQKEQIVAVLPKCSLGFSFRDAASRHNSFIYSDVHLGKNTVRLAGLVERVDDNDSATVTHPDSKSRLQQSNASVTSINTSFLTMENIQTGVAKVAEQAKIILTHAYHNSQFVVQEVCSTEFPRKWYQAADRVVNQVPITLDNAQKFTRWVCKEGYRWASGKEGGHNDN